MNLSEKYFLTFKCFAVASPVSHKKNSMMNKYLLILFCIVLLVITPVIAAGSAPESDFLFTSGDGTIIALFPDKPKTQEIKQEGVELTLAAAEKDGNQFLITFGPNRKNIDLLDSVHGMAQRVGGKIVAVQDIRLNGFSGKKALIEFDGGWILTKNFEDTGDQRLYTAAIISREIEFLKGETAAKFLGSLHLKKILSK